MRIFLAALVFLVFFGLDGAHSTADAKHHVAKHISPGARPQYNPKYAAFVVDGDTGKILYQEDADELRHPASLTKMMTLYLLFEALESKKLKMDSVLTASAYAAGKAKTNLNMQAGQTITAGEAMLAIIVKSANDAATIVGETLGGSEPNFARMMNTRAKQLGMKNSHFVNACGLHDPQQVTTAKDMALLGIALKKHFPQYFKYFSYREFTYNGVNYKGHNHVMEMYPGADGLKTGFVNASGFNLVTTATRRGINLVGVVLGGRTHQSRDQQMMKLLDDGFEKAASLKNMTYATSDYKAPAPGSNDDENADEETSGADDSAPAIGAVVHAVPAANPAVTARTEVVNKVVAEDNAVQKPDAAIDQNEPKKTKPAPAAVADDDDDTAIETYETNKYVRSLASTKQSKTQRYKSDMVIQPLTGNASQPLFVPTPKDKPQL